MSGTAFAEKIGIDQTALSRLLLADRKPSLPTSLAIARETGGKVPPESWLVKVKPKARPPRFRRNGKDATR